MLLTMTASSFGGDGDLKWGSAAARKSRGVATRAVYHAERGRVSATRIVDRQVKTAAFNDPPAGSAERSVLAPGSRPVRLAQDANGADDAFDFGDELERQFETPMGDDEPIAPPTFDDPPNFDDPLPFEELPLNKPADEPPAADDKTEPLPPVAPPVAPPMTEPPAIELPEPEPPAPADVPPPIASPAQPKFDPFDASDDPAADDSPAFDTKPELLQPLPDPDAERREQERAEAVEECAEELATLRASNLSMLDITIGRIGVEGEDYPFVCSIDDGVPLSPRCWAPVTYTWKASALCHKPLYFEQEQLERYGHSWGPLLQPIVSGAHFFGHLAVLPYSMGLKAPNECVYALGHYRPGSCAPYLIPAVPFTWRAALFQAGAATGAAVVIP